MAVRETTLAMGALALFGTQVRHGWPERSNTLAPMARVWTGTVIFFYGVDHLLHPEYSPGVPNTRLTPTWVPPPLLLAYLTGILLITFGVAMFVRKYASFAGTLARLLMVLLTLALYVPEFFLARSVSQQVIAINFVADTLLFSGTLLVITKSISDSQSRAIALAAAMQR